MTDHPECDPYHLDFGSDQHNALLGILNNTSYRADASFKVDVLSGSYRFTDESPVLDVEDCLLFPNITLLRMLWAYRISIVRGNPRVEFAHWWHSAKVHAPNWAGFASDRCSEAALPYAEEASLKCRQFCKEFVQLERRIRKQN